MKALKVIGAGCGGCLILVIVIAAVAYSFLPSESTVERSVVMEAPTAVVFPIVDTPRRWPDWDPWTPYDPDMEREYKGPVAGKGAESHWSSDTDEVGTGFFRIDESVPGDRIVMHLEFTAPFESWSTGTFTFEDVDGGTKVTWSNYTELEGGMRLLGPFFDAMLGPQFEVGLANLAEIAEKEAKTPLGQAKGAIEDVTDAAKKIGEELGIGGE